MIAAPAGLTRIGFGPLLRLRTDEQLVALFRAGSEDAFGVLHDRFRQRLFAYARQMLGGSPQDAEDVLQDVFVRAYSSLRANDRPIAVRPWLYRVAHNRCIDQLRKPTPPAADVFEMSRKPLHDPIVEAQRREDLRRLVEDVGRLPAQQRSALLMREIDGLSYADLAVALDVSVPAIKSLLVRARVGLVEAVEARDTDCSEIREDLLGSYDRGVKASARARRHMRECPGCCEYRTALRGMRRSFAALSPLGFAPLALVAQMVGIGGAGGSAAVGATSAGSGLALTQIGASAVACKVAAVVCTAALATGGAVEVTRLTTAHPARSADASPSRASSHAAPLARDRTVAAAAAPGFPQAHLRASSALAGTGPAPRHVDAELAGKPPLAPTRHHAQTQVTATLPTVTSPVPAAQLPEPGSLDPAAVDTPPGTFAPVEASPPSLGEPSALSRPAPSGSTGPVSQPATTPVVPGTPSPAAPPASAPVPPSTAPTAPVDPAPPAEPESTDAAVTTHTGS